MEDDRIKTTFNDSASPGPLTLEQAVEVFDRLADMEDIAFGYPRDGCYARAHIMCRRLSEMGITPKKSWAFEGDRPLSVNLTDRKIQWCYHVAAALPVKMPDGRIQDMVIDPGLFNGPVTLAEWGGIMGASPDKLQITPFGIAPSGYLHDYEPTLWYMSTSPEADVRSAEVMERYLSWQDVHQRTVFPSQSRQQVLQGQPAYSPPTGKTWVTMDVTPPPVVQQPSGQPQMKAP